MNHPKKKQNKLIWPLAEGICFKTMLNRDEAPSDDPNHDGFKVRNLR